MMCSAKFPQRVPSPARGFPDLPFPWLPPIKLRSSLIISQTQKEHIEMQTSTATLMLLLVVGAHGRPQFGGSFGGFGQNCQGSQCNQNNAGGGGGGGFFAQNCQGSQCNQNNIAGGAGRFGGFPFPPTNFNNQVQNCQGSQCNQNNAGGGFGGFGGGFPFGK